MGIREKSALLETCWWWSMGACGRFSRYYSMVCGAGALKRQGWREGSPGLGVD